MSRINPSIAHQCADCGHVEKPAAKKEGDISLELVLWVSALLGGWLYPAFWLYALAPGLFYSAWRHTTPRYVCPCCGSNDLVSAHPLQKLDMD